MRMPMTENIVHTAKLTVKASVFIDSTEYCLRVSKTGAPRPFGPWAGSTVPVVRPSVMVDAPL